MSGQLLGAAAFQQRFRQRLTLFGGQFSTNNNADSGGDLIRDSHQLGLDDPVLGGIKCHLAIVNRIGFEPITRKFARIAFMCKRRMSMELTKVQITSRSPLAGFVKLKVTRANAVVNECPFNIPVDRVTEALHSLFRHVRKWRSIRFYRWANMSGGLAADDVWDTEFNRQLLDAILTESSEAIDIHRFHVMMRREEEDKMAAFVRRAAANLRHFDVYLPPGSFPELALAICHCQNLSLLWLYGCTPAHFPPDFLGRALALPQLTSMLLGYSPNAVNIHAPDGQGHRLTRRHFPGLHSLSIDEDWLPFIIGRLAELQEVLQKVQHLKIVNMWNLGHEDDPIADVWRIVAAMRSPPFVDLDYYNSMTAWTSVWQDCLPMAYRTGANMERQLERGLARITAEQFEEGLATLPPIVQNALTAPDLENAPIKDDSYQKLEFCFSNGAKVTFKTLP